MNFKTFIPVFAALSLLAPIPSQADSFDDYHYSQQERFREFDNRQRMLQQKMEFESQMRHQNWETQQRGW